MKQLQNSKSNICRHFSHLEWAYLAASVNGGLRIRVYVAYKG